MTNQEIEYLIYLLETKQGFKTRDPLIVHANLSKMDMYNLQWKLEKLKS